MMNRRAFFGRLAGVVAGATVVPMMTANGDSGVHDWPTHGLVLPMPSKSDMIYKVRYRQSWDTVRWGGGYVDGKESTGSV